MKYDFGSCLSLYGVYLQTIRFYFIFFAAITLLNAIYFLATIQ